MENQIKSLQELYSKTSKHSNYQILSKKLSLLIDKNNIIVKSRFEEERLNYILSRLEIKGKKILDIGCNTGFFTFELLEAGASLSVLYEGNPDHALFVKEAGKLLQYEDKLSVKDSYFTFKNELNNTTFDITLLLNVLHHAGDDYGENNLSIENAKKQIIDSINFFADKTDQLIFQLGFCWKGDRDLLLFDKGSKKEMIDFIKSGTEKNWRIEEIAVAENTNGKVEYKILNQINIERNDKMGEFLNRPLFIMKSLNRHS